MYTNWDILFTLEGGKRLLSGGTYLTDMFDNNPPLIYYLCMLITLISYGSSLSSLLLYTLLIYFFVFYSLITCYYLLRLCSHYDQASNFKINALIGVLAFCLLIIPGSNFGERDHLMVILTMPYFFLLYQLVGPTSRALCVGSRQGARDVEIGGKSVSRQLRIIISLLAAFGFALKPHFLFSLVFAELLFMAWNRTSLARETKQIGQKKWPSFFRLETGLIAVFILIYLISIAVFMPSYYQDILPFVLDFYAFNNNGLVPVIASTAIINALLIISSYVFFRGPIERLEQLMIALLLGFALSYLLQAKGWYYHILPLITINSLLVTLVLFKLANRNPKPFVWLTILASAQIPLTLAPSYLNDYAQISCYKQDSCQYRPLIAIAKQYAYQKPIFFFSTLMSYTIPIIYYSHASQASRFPSFWLLSGILNRQWITGDCGAVCQSAQNKVRDYVIEDFMRFKPKLVFVDISPQKAYIKKPFNYLDFMQKSPIFKNLWQHYCYMETVTYYAIYRQCSDKLANINAPEMKRYS
jgi:hypothetical protein